VPIDCLRKTPVALIIRSRYVSDPQSERECIGRSWRARALLDAAFAQPRHMRTCQRLSGTGRRADEGLALSGCAPGLLSRIRIRNRCRKTGSELSNAIRDSRRFKVCICGECSEISRRDLPRGRGENFRENATRLVGTVRFLWNQSAKEAVAGAG